MKQTDLAWAAGFMDGEAWVGRTSGKWPCAAIEVYQSLEAPLIKLQGLFGGTITEVKNRSKLQRKTAWRWRLYGKKAETVLGLLMPYLVVKRDNAKRACRDHNETNLLKAA